MFIRMTAGRPVLAEPETFTALSVQVADRAALTALSEAIGGRVEGDTLWLPIPALHALAGERDADWHRAFDGMIAYADSKGWCAGDNVRAHAEFAEG